MALHSDAWKIVLAAILCMTPACGRRSELVRVSGRVEVNGKPLPNAGISVVPEAGRSARARLDADGRFTLSTYALNDGVVRGTHRVELFAVEQISPKQRRWLVPRSHTDIATSPLRLTVDEPTNDALISVDTGDWEPEIETLTGGE